MYRTKHCVFAALIICAAGASKAAAETLEDVKKKIHEKVSAMKSLEYKLEMTTEMDMPQMAIKSSTKQTAQFVNKGDHVLARMETSSSTTQKMGDQEQKYDSKSLDVCDGKFWYNLSEQMGQQMATKRKIKPEGDPSPFNALASFKQLAEAFEVKLMPDETIDGKPAWVLETKPKPGTDPMNVMGRSLSFYDKETGVSIKGENYDTNGKIVSKVKTTDIKINSQIDPAKFEFKPPPGVQVMEQTTEMPGMP